MNESNQFNKILKYKTCFVFDFDGVIKDSIPAKTAAFIKLYEHAGERVMQQVRDYHLKNGGMPRSEKFKYYEETLLHKKVNNSRISELCNQFSNIVKKEVINSKPIPGVMKFLDNLIKNNFLTAVNSATPISELEEIVYHSNYNKYFNRIYGSPKTKVENLISIINDFKISSKELIFFGDAQSDLNAAKELNISFIGIGNYFKKNDNKKYDDCLFVEDFNSLN